MNKFLLSLALVAVLGYSATATPSTTCSNNILSAFKISFKPGGFWDLARKVAEINLELWKKIGDDCTNGGLFNGILYVEQKDGNNSALGVLYDVQGAPAGIMMLIDKNTVNDSRNPLDYSLISVYQNYTLDGVEYYLIIAYFIDPSKICTVGRTQEEVDAQGTAPQVLIQNGTSPDSCFEIPPTRPGPESETGWTTNNCFPAMGYHHFYGIISQYNATNCKEMVPVFGLYDKTTRCLHGFGLITPGNLSSKSEKIENPPEAAIRPILGEGRVPQCVVDMANTILVSSYHIYFVDKPLLITCPFWETLKAQGASFTEWIRISWPIFG